jgi:hypothetical protein
MIRSMEPAWLNHWFASVRDEFSEVVSPFAGKPCVYVEVGCWAGACCEFMARNVLTHPDSVGFGIDPYPPDRKRYDVPKVREMAHERMEFFPNWSWVEMPSLTGIPTVCKVIEGAGRKIDILYLDGLHEANAVVIDFAQAWSHLRPGSVVIFDDYYTSVERGWPNVKEAVQAISIAFKGLIRPIGKHRRQCAVEVLHLDLGPVRGREQRVKECEQI